METNNKALQAALTYYDNVRDRYIETLEDKGLAFTKPNQGADVRRALRSELRRRGACFANAGASIRVGWISQACIECTGNRGSETFSTTFKCHRDCYFCFNYNQADYDKFVREGCPWEEGLDRAAHTYEHLACLGLTGGEPLLNLDDTIRFLERAGELFPNTHKRMYTSGDLLTEEAAKRLRDAGLHEIRFSVKNDDPEKLQQRVLANMELAGRYIPDVMVEMPIVPGTEAEMKELMRQFDKAGIKGMNLLEFCFPFHSWDEFARRGFEIRNPPFDVMYDYGYSGGLPVAGSEELALSLMLFALDEGLSFGLHYCSLDNKHRSEMRQMNERAAHVHPCYQFDEGDFFLKTAKVYGDDRALARAVLDGAGCTDYLVDEEEASIAFPPRYLPVLKGTPVTPVSSVAVLEAHEDGHYLSEVAIQPIEELEAASGAQSGRAGGQQAARSAQHDTADKPTAQR